MPASGQPIHEREDRECQRIAPPMRNRDRTAPAPARSLRRHSNFLELVVKVTNTGDQLVIHLLSGQFESKATAADLQ
jgi:hypothetical protein